MINFNKCVYTKWFIYLFFSSSVRLLCFGEKFSLDAARLEEYKNEITVSDRYDKLTQSYNITGSRIRKTRAANGFCMVPASTPDKTISYDCPEGAPCLTDESVRQFTVATINCTPDYFPVPETKFQSTCYRRDWSPPIDRCYKKCDKLKPVNVDMQCFRKGINITCDENSLVPGAKVRPKCKHLYKYANVLPDYQEIVCNSDGKWDRELSPCVPVCGRPFAKTAKLIYDEIDQHFGNSPWHVAIFNKDKVLICGGTIISERLVLSAAHCFYDQEKHLKFNAVDYEIVVSKVTRNYSVKDNQYQKVYKIDEIRFPDKGYTGLDSYHDADIVILILHENITLSPTILPACVNWIPVPKPPEGTLGKVVGWGMNEHGNYTEHLLTANLPFISRSRCRVIVPDDSKRYLTLDKFCAGLEKGAGTLPGDSGGGLLFREGNLYYLRGIASLKPETSTNISVFTDIAEHIEWILSIKNAIDNGLLLPKKIPSECGIETGKPNQSAPWHVSIYNVTENRVTCGGTIISARLILSAADCFNSPVDLNQYEVIVNEMSKSRKAFKIKELRFSQTDRTNASYDIVILILSEKMTFNSEISPACVEWNRSTEFRAPEGTLGKFVGWYLNKNGSTVLRSDSLPFMSHDICDDKLYSNVYKVYVQFDKFCADLKIPYFDSSRGSGFIFQQDGRNYIRGIMSIRLPAQVGVALFTDIAHYINLIIAVLNETE